MKQQYSYDLVQYKSYSYPQSHPDHLAVLANLFGLSPAPITACRVLEIGCASGGNLIPMAFYLPNSQFIGVDLSARHIETGKKTIDDLGLTNISIRHMDLMDIDPSWGTFDYIIIHGVYSWVPEAVQEKIMTVSSQNLSQNGIVYISYNTYPGWHIREMIRHMMLYHTAQFAEPKEKIEQARALMDFLTSATPEKHNYFGLLLKSELDLIKRANDWYLFHDHLEDNNRPVYFHQFIEKAQKHDLQYLAEANLSTMLASGFPEQVEETLGNISRDVVSTEQYMDFLRNRPFRQTLLCHTGLPLERNLLAKSLENLLIASSAASVSNVVDFDPETKEIFKTPFGSWTKTNCPITKAALTILNNYWPKAMPFDLLVERALNLLTENSDILEIDQERDRELLGQDLLNCFSGNVVEFHSNQPDLPDSVSDRPQANALATYQATQEMQIINPRHEFVDLDPVSKELLKIMDNRKTQEELIDCLIERATAGAFALKKDNKKITKAEDMETALKDTLGGLLNKLAEQGLLAP